MNYPFQGKKRSFKIFTCINFVYLLCPIIFENIEKLLKQIARNCYELLGPNWDKVTHLGTNGKCL